MFGTAQWFLTKSPKVKKKKSTSLISELIFILKTHILKVHNEKQALNLFSVVGEVWEWWQCNFVPFPSYPFKYFFFDSLLKSVKILIFQGHGSLYSSIGSMTEF